MIQPQSDNLQSAKLIYPEFSAAARAELVRVRSAGIELDRYGQILPEFNRTNELKIANDLLDVRHQVIGALGRGKHVVYVPGSYDLVHLGHASYIMQAVDFYLADRKDLTREDLFVVALSDDDNLIQAVKPPHLTNQSGEHPRPIERLELFEHCATHHPRLWDLASLPVDLVGFIPAPSSLGTLLKHNEFNSWLKYTAGAQEKNSSHLEIQSDYERLITAMCNEDYAEIKKDFQKVRFGLDFGGDRPLWDIASWQALMHRFIGNVYQEESSQRYTRIISEHDVKYKDQVAELMQTCGISYQFINDLMVVSTTRLVQKFGWEALLTSKIKHYEAHKATRA